MMKAILGPGSLSILPHKRYSSAVSEAVSWVRLVISSFASRSIRIFPQNSFTCFRRAVLRRNRSKETAAVAGNPAWQKLAVSVTAFPVMLVLRTVNSGRSEGKKKEVRKWRVSGPPQNYYPKTYSLSRLCCVERFAANHTAESQQSGAQHDHASGFRSGGDVCIRAVGRWAAVSSEDFFDRQGVQT
jgi:hypothetical protein